MEEIQIQKYLQLVLVGESPHEKLLMDYCLETELLVFGNFYLKVESSTHLII